jgi:hypothetical protein
MSDLIFSRCARKRPLATEATSIEGREIARVVRAAAQTLAYCPPIKEAIPRALPKETVLGTGLNREPIGQ